MTSGGPAAVSGREHIPRNWREAAPRTATATPRSQSGSRRSCAFSAGNSVHYERDGDALPLLKLAGLHVEVESVLSGRQTRGFEIEEKFRRALGAGRRSTQQRDVRRALCSCGVANTHRELQPFRIQVVSEEGNLVRAISLHGRCGARDEAL